MLALVVVIGAITLITLASIPQTDTDSNVRSPGGEKRELTISEPNLRYYLTLVMKYGCVLTGLTKHSGMPLLGSLDLWMLIWQDVSLSCAHDGATTAKSGASRGNPSLTHGIHICNPLQVDLESTHHPCPAETDELEDLPSAQSPMSA